MSAVAARRRCTRMQMLRLSVGAMSGAMLAACTIPGRGGTTIAEPDASTAPASITVWYNLYAAAVPAWEQTAREFQSKRPNITVTLEGLASEHEAKQLAAIAGGAPPDIMYIHPMWNASFALQGALVALEPYLARSKSTLDLSDYYPGAIDFFRWDGKLWALPNYSGPQMFYYNVGLLQRFGLPDPWQLYQKGQWTISAFDDMIYKASGGTGDTRTYGWNEVSRSIRNQCPWIFGHGGQVWDTKVAETLIHRDEAVKAWDYLANQVIKTYTAPSGPLQLFVQGRLLLYLQIRADLPNFRDVTFGTVPMYKMPDGKEYNRDGPNGLGISEASRAKGAAWEFLMFEVTRGVELKMGVGWTAPTSRTLAKSPEWLNLLVSGESAAAYDAAACQVKALPLPPRASEIDKLIQAAYAKVAKGESSAKAAMAEVKPQVDAILAEVSRRS